MEMETEMEKEMEYGIKKNYVKEGSSWLFWKKLYKQ